jgi:hypothetical protein
LFCELDIIGKTANLIVDKDTNKELKRMGFYGHLMKIIKIYSSIQTINENIIQTIKNYKLLWTKVAIDIIKPYDECCLKDLGSYQIEVIQVPVEYKIRQMSFITPQSKTAITEIIDE